MPKAKRTSAKKLTKNPTAKFSSYLDVPNLRRYWNQYRSKKLTWVVVLVLGLLILGLAKRSYFIAAMVNGQPITNFELQRKLNDQFRSQALGQLVDEKIVKDEARKRGVVVSPAEVETKVAEIEKNFGGKDVLDSLLTQQGQTRESLRKNLLLQVMIEKMYGGEASVSAEEIEAFISQNQQQLSTNSAEAYKQAADNLKQQKLGQLFSQKFQELKQNAKIQLF